MNTASLILLVFKAFTMLFILRFLILSSSAYYFHPICQSVIKLTNPLANLPFVRTLSIGRYFIGPLIIAFLISLVCWVVLSFVTSYTPAITSLLLLGFLTFLKAFGYLLVLLLFIQALCSWLPSTREISILLGQITYPIVAPVQRIIPPIGMIDISLMVVLLVIFALDNILAKIFGMLWLIA